MGPQIKQKHYKTRSLKRKALTDPLKSGSGSEY
jgi:hypothetical protein